LERSSLQSFWACFARNQVLENAQFLENSGLPILEVNAGYPLEVADVAKLEQAFHDRGKPGILILPDDPNLELASSNAQFQPYSSLVMLEVQSDANDLVVEQVSWTQATALAKVWCVQHQALNWQEFITKEITRGMQQHPNLTAYLAFEDHEPTGMMIALETGFAGWIAGKSRALQALTHRLSSDFTEAVVTMPLEKLEMLPNDRVLDRYSIWFKIR
jgi:hypothetical protein